MHKTTLGVGLHLFFSMDLHVGSVTQFLNIYLLFTDLLQNIDPGDSSEGHPFASSDSVLVETYGIHNSRLHFAFCVFTALFSDSLWHCFLPGDSHRRCFCVGVGCFPQSGLLRFLQVMTGTGKETLPVSAVFRMNPRAMSATSA